jgi:ABC-type multidrug transport system ATPase subunit
MCNLHSVVSHLIYSSCVEATASVDRQTERLLLDALDESFRGRTVLTVAHRLDTVIDNDYIMVMDNGSVVEFGPPAKLIRDNGAFGSMVMDTGGRMSKSLQYTAQKNERTGSIDLMKDEEEILVDIAEMYGEMRGERYANAGKIKPVQASANTPRSRRKLISKGNYL